MGPILIFDKSTLQSLSVDESVWLHAFYHVNLTPLFFVETLADLEKEKRERRSPETVVGNLAMKTAPMGAKPNAFHLEICEAELCGQTFDLLGQVVISSSRVVPTADGRGVLVRPSVEEEAMQRWQKGEFLQVERLFARIWRAALSAFDLKKLEISPEGCPKPKTLEEAYKIACAGISRSGWRLRTLETTLDGFRIHGQTRRDIVSRWKAAGGPPLREFVPFTAHVMIVDLFFGICLEAGLIGSERASNRVDIAYLYYLPFCMVFTSNDKLHARTVPLFLRADQRFVPGSELKADLARLDEHYFQLPDSVKEQGVLVFAQRPPADGGFLTTRLWDELVRKNWREDASRPPLTAEQEAALLKLVNHYSTPSEAASGSPVDLREAGGLVVQSRVPVRMGKWRLVPPGAEKKKPNDS